MTRSIASPGLAARLLISAGSVNARIDARPVSASENAADDAAGSSIAEAIAMLLAPLLPVSLSQPSVHRPARARLSTTRPLLTDAARSAVLVGWALLGGLALLCIPALRGGPMTGWTVPFWLLAAPLLNLAALAWLRRGANRTSRRR